MIPHIESRMINLPVELGRISENLPLRLRGRFSLPCPCPCSAGRFKPDIAKRIIRWHDFISRCMPCEKYLIYLHLEICDIVYGVFSVKLKPNQFVLTPNPKHLKQPKWSNCFRTDTSNSLKPVVRPSVCPFVPPSARFTFGPEGPFSPPHEL